MVEMKTYESQGDKTRFLWHFPDAEKHFIEMLEANPEYQFKVTLGKKRGSPALAKWIDSNPTLGKMGDTCKHECYHEGWVKGYYFFVKNSQSLLIAELMVGDNITRLEKLVYVPD